MRALVFAAPARRKALEGILHPLIQATVRDELSQLAKGDSVSRPPYVLIAVPLLVESGHWLHRVDRVLVVDCPEEVQVARVMARSGLSEAQVRSIMAAQASRAQRLADYKVYVQKEAEQLVTKTTAFSAAVKAGKIEEAKAMFADVRSHYERIEPIAELFNELDPAIDAREDDFKNGAKDEGFTGFHRIEHALWVENSTKGIDTVADKLEEDVKTLKKEIDLLSFPPSKVVGGAAALIEEVAGSKISGEEDRYSHTDLSDFQANVDGSKKIVDLFRPMIAEKDKALLEKVDANFKQVNDLLAKYKKGNGFETYDKLTEADRKALQAPINALAEDLAKLRGILGLN